MQRNIQYVFAGAALLIATSAFAESADVTAGVMSQFEAATKSINAKLVSPALGTACAAVMLQWIFSHWKDIFNGELSNSLAKIVGLITWFGATVALINNMALLTDTFTRYLGLAGSLSGLSASEFSPGSLIDNGVKMITATNEAFAKAADEHWYQMGQNFLGAAMLMFANIFTFLGFLVIALTLFVAQLEFWIMFSVAPLAFGLIPLSAFRDQGFAPIKGVISLGLRLLILGVVVAVSKSLTDTVIRLLTNPGLPAGVSVMTPIWYYLAGIAGCAMMALSAGKIASSIASGSASFSGADAVRGGMQMATTAAAGAGAIVAGKAALASAVGKAPSANALGQAVGSMTASAPSLGVSPTGGSSPAASSLGGSPVQERPGATSSGAAPQSSTNTNSAASPSSTPSGAGDASNAGIGGTGAPAASPAPTNPNSAASPAGDASNAGIGGANSPAASSGSREPTAWDNARSAMGKAAEQHTQDNQTVGVQIHVGKD